MFAGTSGSGRWPWSVAAGSSPRCSTTSRRRWRPIDASRAADLLRTLRTSALLDGVRGRPAVDIDAVAEQIAAITRFACAHPEIADFEVNPLLATAHGAVALDARAIAVGDVKDETEGN